MIKKICNWNWILFALMTLAHPCLATAHNPQGKNYDQDIQEIVRSSKACMDAKTVGEGKCTSKLGKDFFGGKERALQELGSKQTKVQSSEVIVFVSLSMPPASLKSIHRDVTKVGGRMVVRGLVDGSFKKTQEKMSKLALTVDVDPPLFEQYDVKQVPVIMNRLNDTQVDILRGNIRLEAALEAFSRDGDHQGQALHHLKTLRGEFR